LKHLTGKRILNREGEMKRKRAERAETRIGIEIVIAGKEAKVGTGTGRVIKEEIVVVMTRIVTVNGAAEVETVVIVAVMIARTVVIDVVVLAVTAGENPVPRHRPSEGVVVDSEAVDHNAEVFPGAH